MAKFAAQSLLSVRANKLVVGETYTMGTSKDAATHVLVEFQGFFDAEGNKVENPRVLKAMPQDWTMKVLAFKDGIAPVETTIVKDPKGRGEVHTEVNGKLQRVTFAATPELVKALHDKEVAEINARKAEEKAQKEAEKAAKATAKESAKEEAPAEEVTEEVAE